MITLNKAQLPNIYFYFIVNEASVLSVLQAFQRKFYKSTFEKQPHLFFILYTLA